MAVANYHDAYGQYPPAYIADAAGRPIQSWRVLLLPYLDQQDLYTQYDFSEPWNGPRNSRLASRMPEIYALHGEHRPELAMTNYLGVVGPETIWPGATALSSKDVPDGSSSTILVVENLGAGVNWMEPRDLTFSEMSFQFNSPAGISSKHAEPAVVMLDGTLHTLKPALEPATLRALLTVNSGEEIVRDESGWSLLADGRDREPAMP